MKKIGLLAAFLICSFSAFSQSETESSEKKFKFGINLGLNHSNLIIDEANVSTDIGFLNDIGFQLGILTDYQFLKYISFSPRAKIAFNESNLLITDNGVTKKYAIMPIELGISTYLIFRKPTGKMKPYLFVGPTFKAPLTEQTTTSDEFGTNPDLSIDFGIGLENVFEHFSFAPEFRYSYGLLHVNQNPTLRSLRLHQVSLVFNFLG